MLGLDISDTLGWDTLDAWVEKVHDLKWSIELLPIPKRLREIYWNNKNLAGTLDMRKCTIKKQKKIIIHNF